MKNIAVFMALLLALSMNATSAQAQFLAPRPTPPPKPQVQVPLHADEHGNPFDGEEDDSLAPGAQPRLAPVPDPIGKAPKTVKPDDKDDIVIIQGPRMGSRPGKPQITPEIFEALFNGIWVKVSQDYHDTGKLRDWQKWEHRFDGKLKTEEDFDAAVHAMLGSLNDRWTIYYSPAEIAQERENAKQGIISIGMMLRKHADDAWHIDNLQFNSPAMLSTLREGDAIKSVNGKKLDNSSSAAEVRKLLSGKLGDKVTVVAQYDGAEHSVELTFAKQAPDRVIVGMLPGNFAYVRLPSFMDPKALEQIVMQLGQVFEESQGQINGLIFDLRYNSGGLVTMALDISSMFVEKGTITATTTREDRRITETITKVTAIPDYLEARMPKDAGEFAHFLLTVPMVVLTNGSSASASEITTGALHDNQRAFVIGTKTFGKAVGYTQEGLPNGGGLQVTNLSYLTPNGTNICDTGIVPNQVVEQPRGVKILDKTDEQIKAAIEHLTAIAQVRAKQLSEAQELATKAHVTPPPVVTVQKTQHLHVIYLVLGTMGGLTLLLLVGFARSALKRNRRN